MRRELLVRLAAAVIVTLQSGAIGATQLQQITFLNRGYDAGNGKPTWSPDGSRIAYAYTWVEPGHWFFLFGTIGIVRLADLAAIPFDSQYPMCFPDAWLGNPAWSPAGDRIAYTCNGSVWTGSVTEKRASPLTGAQGDRPAWSPDGTRIAFSSSFHGISVIPVAGGAVSTLTDGSDGHPAWSRDGQWIAFSSRRSGDLDIWIVPAAGGTPRALTHGAAADDNPSWSPDGRFIAFESDRSGNSDVWIVRVENGALSQLTNDPAWDGDPSWSPDGSRIAFASNRSGYANIWVATDLRTVGVQPVTWGQMQQRYR